MLSCQEQKLIVTLTTQESTYDTSNCLDLRPPNLASHITKTSLCTVQFVLQGKRSSHLAQDVQDLGWRFGSWGFSFLESPRGLYFAEGCVLFLWYLQMFKPSLHECISKLKNHWDSKSNKEMLWHKNSNLLGLLKSNDHTSSLYLLVWPRYWLGVSALGTVQLSRSANRTHSFRKIRISSVKGASTKAVDSGGWEIGAVGTGKKQWGWKEVGRRWWYRGPRAEWHLARIMWCFEWSPDDGELT